MFCTLVWRVLVQKTRAKRRYAREDVGRNGRAMDVWSVVYQRRVLLRARREEERRGGEEETKDESREREGVL